MNVGVNRYFSPAASADCCRDETVRISGAGCTALSVAPRSAGMDLLTVWNWRCELALSS